MADLQTNLNVAPFYDDYDEDKQYYRILFRPATAVQARELTQIQTILQKQISRFGDSIYKDGTIIEGCNFSTYPNIEQVRFKDGTTSTIDFSLLTTNYADIANSYMLVSNTSGLRATVFRAFTGAESVVDLGLFDTNRAYVLYVNSGNTGGTQVTQFQSNEQIDVYSPLQDKNGILNAANKQGICYTLTSNSTINVVSVGYGMHVGPGIVYQKGFFQKSLPSNFIIREHGSNAAGIRIGFDTKEYIVQPVSDPSLYDNSIGSPNYAAPGAYRLKLVPEPVFYDAANNSVTVPTNFLPVVEFDGGDGRIVELQKDPQLSTLGDIMATRTREESGDYIVKPFQVDVTSHESNNYLFYYNASPGIAYIDGYRVELLSPRKIAVDRATTTNSISNQIITTNFGNYIEVAEVAGTLDVANYQEVDLRDQPQQVLSLYHTRSLASGDVVGKANVRAFQFEDDTKGTPTGKHLLYLFNIRMNPGKNFANDAKSISKAGAYGNVFMDFVLTNGKAIIQDTSLAKAVFNTGLTGVKRLTNMNGTNDTSFVYTSTVNAAIVTSGTKSTATFVLPGADVYNYGVGFMTDFLSREVNLTFAQDSLSKILNTNCSVSAANSTTADITSTSDFTQGLYVGHQVRIVNTATSSASYGTIAAINSSNSITITPNTNLSGLLSIQKFFKKGTFVNLAGSGNTVQILTSQSLQVEMEFNPLLTNYELYGQIPAVSNPAYPIKKLVNKGRYIKIDCSTNAGGATGPWILGLPDVYKVTNVHVGATYSETNQDVKEWFDLSTGQTDTHYGLSKLVLIPRYKNNITASSKILVKLNHFTPQITTTQRGFFSIDSYPIDDANTANVIAIGTAEIPIYVDNALVKYDLRNHIDFRPMLANTAESSVSVAGATINPIDNNTTFTLGAGSAQLSPVPDSNFTYDVEFYLPRIDNFIINKDGSLDVKKGIPDIRPVPPALNKSGMVIAEIFVPPYPSLTFKEAE